ncbi:MAG TPA: 2-phospho-L-lactate transferase CofD family protein, partial [Acidimicrobiia bacterium]|nr:2-phospho-L-lactate transferase CofD family protein [Acidimicrobiia bacterium]
VDLAGQMLGAVGRVVPAANQAAELTAVVGGKRVSGQALITKARSGISAMEVGPEGLTANPAALSAIAGADQIVLGPGSLFTSLMAVLLVPGVAQAWASSRAKKVFVLNLIEQDGETLGMSGADHLAALSKIAGIEGPGIVVSHRGEFIIPAHLTAVTLSDDEALTLDWQVVEADLTDPDADWPAHEPMALGQVLGELF